MCLLCAILLESALEDGAQAGHRLAAVLEEVELAQRPPGHLPREPALANLVAGRRVLVHHLVDRAGIAQQIQPAPRARLELLGFVMDLQAHEQDTSHNAGNQQEHFPSYRVVSTFNVRLVDGILTRL